MQCMIFFFRVEFCMYFLFLVDVSGIGDQLNKEQFDELHRVSIKIHIHVVVSSITFGSLVSFHCTELWKYEGISTW